MFSAPSGAGKTTLVRHLLGTSQGLELSVSVCSREKRKNETDGRDYCFLTAEEFKQKIDANEFLEWEEVYKDRFYGTLRSEVERIISSGKNIVFDIDVEGALTIKKEFGDDAVTIFIKPPSIDALLSRLNNRGTENKESLVERINKAEHELSFEDRFDFVVVNDDLAVAKKEVEGIVGHFLL